MRQRDDVHDPSMTDSRDDNDNENDDDENDDDDDEDDGGSHDDRDAMRGRCPPQRQMSVASSLVGPANPNLQARLKGQNVAHCVQPRGQRAGDWVLGCVECSFRCESNNQLSRHMSITMHGLSRCTHPRCSVRLVCSAFVQGVNKFLSRARRERGLDYLSVDTPEHHRELTDHCNSVVYEREHFVMVLQPGDQLQPSGPDSTAPVIGSGCRFTCPECQVTRSTWSQMTRHLDTSQHAVSICAKCSAVLRCYGASQPTRHERVCAHYGVKGAYYAKMDLVERPRGEPSVPQWHCDVCGITFLTAIHMAEHLIDCHNATATPPSGAGAEHTTNASVGSEGHREAAPGTDAMEVSSTAMEPTASTSAATLFSCQQCGEGFASVFEALQHRRNKLVQFQSHNDFLMPQVIDVLVRGFRVKRLPRYPLLGYAPPGAVKRGAILYQCPECCRIFTSWARLEQHLFSTKHSLPFCRECGVVHKLRSGEDDHVGSTQTSKGGHSAVYGEQRTKLDYEVLVDIDDAELMTQIDDKAPQPSEYDPHDAELFIYQCPISTCCKPFMRQLELERHMEDTGHGIVQCGTCSEKLDVLHDDVYFHEHEVPGLSEDMAEFRTKRANGCRVVLREAALLAYFPNDFKKCEECSSPVPDADVTTHRGSLACRAAKARRAAWMTLAQTAADMTLYRGQRTSSPHSAGGFAAISASTPYPRVHINFAQPRAPHTASPAATVGSTSAQAMHRTPLFASQASCGAPFYAMASPTGSDATTTTATSMFVPHPTSMFVPHPLQLPGYGAAQPVFVLGPGQLPFATGGGGSSLAPHPPPNFSLHASSPIPYLPGPRNTSFPVYPDGTGHQTTAVFAYPHPIAQYVAPVPTPMPQLTGYSATAVVPQQAAGSPSYFYPHFIPSLSDPYVTAAYQPNSMVVYHVQPPGGNGGGEPQGQGTTPPRV